MRTTGSRTGGEGRGRPEPITVMADGTIKQVHPISGTEVWTVPGRAHRPLVASGARPLHDGPAARGVPCAFCPERAAEVPPEKARVVRTPRGFETLTHLPPERLADTTAEFRRLPNLFEIVSAEYWRANHHHTPSERAAAHHDAWIRSPQGRRMLDGVLRARYLASGGDEERWAARSAQERLTGSLAFFAGGHDLVVGRRHLTDDGADLASSGSLTPEEHAAYVTLTVRTIADLLEEIPAARHVATFQNWLSPAGASFDHLHKQLVAIDEHGDQVRRELVRRSTDPELYERHVAYVRRQGLVLAENEHAVAFAGFGHRYPTLEVCAKVMDLPPTAMTSQQVRGMSDLVHAMHVATGPEVACNEEWLHRPADVEGTMPWRIQLKWRVSTLAGFEGGTRIYVTTISPWDLHDRVRARLRDARDSDSIARGVVLA